MDTKKNLDLTSDATKFNEKGEALPYYGNTIICFINNEDSPIFYFAKKIQEKVSQGPYSEKMVMLPLASIHMTVIPLLREVDRGTEVWPNYITDVAHFKKIDSILYNKYQKVPKFDALEMKIEKVTLTDIHLSPARKADAENLRNYRDRIVEATGIKHFDHEKYQFHITLAYVYRELSDDEYENASLLSEKLTKMAKEKLQTFTLPQPSFTIFHDMLAYSTDLKKRQG